MKTYKGIIFLDIDGTLTDSGHGRAYPSAAVIRAIGKAEENGYACVICTGRNMSQVSCTDSLKPDGWIFSDGAGVLQRGKKPLIQPFAQKVLKEMMASVEKHHGGQNISGVSGFYATSYALEIGLRLVQEMTEEDQKDRELIRHDFTPLPMAEWKGEPILETDIYFPSETDEQAWLKEKDPAVHYMHVNTLPGRTYGEAVSAGVSKGEGCRKMAELLGCSMKDTFAFGDSMNDLSALQAVHTGIAMGNAPEELKEHADYVCDDVQNDGILSGLRHFHII